MIRPSLTDWLLAILLATSGGCSSLVSTVEWSCDVPARVRLEPTQTTTRCPTTGKLVRIKHPKAAP